MSSYERFQNRSGTVKELISQFGKFEEIREIHFEPIRRRIRINDEFEYVMTARAARAPVRYLPGRNWDQIGVIIGVIDSSRYERAGNARLTNTRRVYFPASRVAVAYEAYRGPGSGGENRESGRVFRGYPRRVFLALRSGQLRLVISSQYRDECRSGIKPRACTRTGPPAMFSPRHRVKLSRWRVKFVNSSPPCLPSLSRDIPRFAKTPFPLPFLARLSYFFKKSVT